MQQTIIIIIIIIIITYLLFTYCFHGVEIWGGAPLYDNATL